MDIFPNNIIIQATVYGNKNSMFLFLNIMDVF